MANPSSASRWRPTPETEELILVYWLLQLAGWGFYFYAQASGEVIFASVPWSEAATLWGVTCAAAIGLTHLFRSQIKRLGWLALPPTAFLTRVVAATLLMATISYLIVMALSMAFHEL